MRIFNWVQNKISGRQLDKKVDEQAYPGAARYHTAPHTTKEEFSDWPHGLLAIGTFGNGTCKGDHHKDHIRATPSPPPPPPVPSAEAEDLTLEEVSRLQKELARLLVPDGRKPGTACREVRWSRANDITTSDVNGGELSPTSKMILRRAREVLAESRGGVLNQRSFSFLLKNLFACRSGFAPAPTLRDPLQASVVEKLLKAIVHKKIYPQNAAPVPARRYLERKKPVVEKDGKEDETPGAKADDGSKWVKTDSEFIVLEM